MNYAETISQLEKQLQNLGEAPKTLLTFFVTSKAGLCWITFYIKINL